MSKITTVALYPLIRAINASPNAVFPAEASIIVESLFNWPSFSALLIILSATRSLIEYPGLVFSSFKNKLHLPVSSLLT